MKEIQNISSIFQKLCLLGQKTQGSEYHYNQNNNTGTSDHIETLLG